MEKRCLVTNAVWGVRLRDKGDLPEWLMKLAVEVIYKRIVYLTDPVVIYICHGSLPDYVPNDPRVRAIYHPSTGGPFCRAIPAEAMNRDPRSGSWEDIPR